jgi:hypothetical protein
MHCLRYVLFITVFSCLGIIVSRACYALEEILKASSESPSRTEISKNHGSQHGIQRNFGLSNFFEGWLTLWETYREDETQAPRVPLIRITPAFFKREFRMNYFYADDEGDGEADVHEWGMALELPLTLRLKIDIEPKVLYVDSHEGGKNAGFGDTKLAMRVMLFETNTILLSTGSVINIPTGDEDRHLGEGITTVGQQLALWTDLGHRMALHTFLGVDVPTGGEHGSSSTSHGSGGFGRDNEHEEDANMEFLYGIAVSRTFTLTNASVLEGITPFIEFNGHKGFGLDKNEMYRIDALPGIRWDLSRELYVMQGFEVPLNGTEEFDKRIWFSIIKDF